MAFLETREERLERRMRQSQEAKRLFNENFPTTFVIIHSILTVVLSLALVAIQIILFVNNAYLGVISNGIWCAAVNLFAIITCLILRKFVKFGLF